MIKFMTSLLFLLGLSATAQAASITLEYRFDATITENAVVCNMFGPKVRYASECSSSAAASPFENLDIGETYGGTIRLGYSDADTLDAVSCAINGLNCSFFAPGPMPTPSASEVNTDTTRLFMGNGWNTISMLDLGTSRFHFENDSPDYAILQASLSNVSLFDMAPSLLTASLTTTSGPALIPTPLPGTAWLALIGLGAFGLMRRRQAA